MNDSKGIRQQETVTQVSDWSHPLTKIGSSRTLGTVHCQCLSFEGAALNRHTPHTHYLRIKVYCMYDRSIPTPDEDHKQKNNKSIQCISSAVRRRTSP